MLHGEKFLKMYSPIHLTMETDVEVTFTHIKSKPTRIDIFGNVVELVEYYKNPIGLTYLDVRLKT